MAKTKKNGSKFDAAVSAAQQGTPLVALGWQDLCGATRVRAIPINHLEAKMDYGLGFPSCMHGLNSTWGIVANKWGPVDEVRQVPAPESLVQVPRTSDYPGFNLVMANSIDIDGEPFECCIRHMYSQALNDLKKEAGVEFCAAFEFEFMISGEGFEPELCMALGALRAAEPMGGFMVAALEQAGFEVEAFEPEFGRGQYELSVKPLWGMAAADGAVAIREIVRDVARHFGFKATFTPKLAPDQVGNGAHIHFSVRDKKGNPAFFDAAQPHGLSVLGGQFAAGIVRHVKAIMPFAATAPVSYSRIGPSSWSAGFTAFGIMNREAVVRTCDLPGKSRKDRARSFNLEFRGADNLCNPYLLLTLLIRAGLQGIREELPTPPAVTVDPATMTAAERKKLGIETLPRSLEDALKCLARDKVVRSWLPESLYEIFLTVKNDEIAGAPLDDPATYARYATTY
jgi:glutamine synthetase